jgi:hypothetical protein
MTSLIIANSLWQRHPLAVSSNGVNADGGCLPYCAQDVEASRKNNGLSIVPMLILLALGHHFGVIEKIRCHSTSLSKLSRALEPLEEIETAASRLPFCLQKIGWSVGKNKKFLIVCVDCCLNCSSQPRDTVRDYLRLLRSAATRPDNLVIMNAHPGNVVKSPHGAEAEWEAMKQAGEIVEHFRCRHVERDQSANQLGLLVGSFVL